MRLVALLVSALLLALPARAAEPASADDTARLLAGMPLPSGSALGPLAAGSGWQRHAAAFDRAFSSVETGQIGRIRAWSALNVTEKRPVLYYFFSGPDFLYANGFYPDASTYVLCGLEPTGPVPDLAKVPARAVPGVLTGLQISLRSLLGHSFFKTRDMREELQASAVGGTLPVLYVFLARAGKSVRDVSLIQLSESGEEQPFGQPTAKTGARGAKITFQSPGGPLQTLYYFSADLSNGGFGRSGLKGFGERLGEGNALVKSASYLLHGNDFSQVRGFLLQRSASILQDDTGVPLTLFDAQWRLRQFGRYLGPIAIFPGRYQPKMAELFRKGPASPIDFGIGYRWRPNESNLLLAVKQAAPKPQETAKAEAPR